MEQNIKNELIEKAKQYGEGEMEFMRFSFELGWSDWMEEFVSLLEPDEKKWKEGIQKVDAALRDIWISAHRCFRVVGKQKSTSFLCEKDREKIKNILGDYYDDWYF